MKFATGMVAMGLAMAVEASPPRPELKGYQWMPAKRAYTGTGTAPMPMLTGTAPIAPVKVIGTGYPVTATMYRPCPTCPPQKIGNNTVVTATAPCPTCPVLTAGGNNGTVIMTKACPTCPLVPVTPTGAPSSQITPNSPFRPGMAFNFANSTANFVQPPATGISGVVGPPAMTVIASTATNGEVTFETVPAAVGSPQSQIEFPVTETAANGQVTVATETAIPANGQNAASPEPGATTQNPSTNEAGSTSESPATNEAGAAPKSPSTNEAGTAPQSPSTNEAGSTSGSPATNEAGAAPQSPSINEAGAAPQSPSTNEAGSTSGSPATNEAGAAPQSPSTNEAGAAPQSPSTNEAGSESQNPSSTEAGTTSPNAESPAESPEAFVGAASTSFRVPITLSAISLALMLLL